MKVIFAALTIAISMLSLTGLSQSAASINITEKEQFVNFEGEYFNKTTDTLQLSYEMLVSKEGKSGTSSQKQSGRFIATPKSTIKLSTSTLNKQTGEKVKITLRILNNNTMVDSTSLNYPENN